MAEVSSQSETWKMLSRLWDESPLPAHEMGVTLAALIYLRWADFQEAEQEAVAAFDDIDYRPVLPSSLHWRSWHLLPPQELKEFFAERLSRALDGLNNSRHISLATHLHRISSEVEKLGQLSPRAVDTLIHWLAEQPFETPRDRRALLDTFDAVLDRIRDKHAGEFRTPAAVARLLIALAAPAAGDRVYDPCFGSAGLLTAATDHVLRKETSQFSRSATPALEIYGVELNLNAYIIGLVRLTLAGVDDPQLELGNSLERMPPTNPQQDGFDVVLANPPWGWKAQQSKEDRWGLQHFPFLTNEGSGLFVQHALQQLRPHGRAVIVVPEGFLFRRGVDQQLRRFLVENHTVEAVVSLPESTFMPYTAIKANILVLRRSGPTRRIRMMDTKALFDKGKGRQAPTISHAMAEELAGWLRSAKPGKHCWDVDPETLAEVDWDFTPKRRNQSGLMGMLDALRSEVDVIALKKCGHILVGRPIKATDLVDGPEGESPIPYVRIKDIQRGQASKGSSWLTREAAASVDARWKLRTGDVLLSKSGTIGKAGVVRNGAVGALAANGLFVLRPDPDRLDPHFLASYLDSSECRAWLDEKARGATVRHLSRQALDEMPVPLPPLQIQHRVATQYREHGVNVLTFLVQLLTEAEDDPIAKWVDDALRYMSSEKSSTFKGPDISWLLHSRALGGGFTSVRNWVAHQPQGENPLASWIVSLTESADILRNSNDIPSGPALYSLLQQAKYTLRDAVAAITGHLPNENKARELTNAFAEHVAAAMAALSGDVRVALSCEINTLKPGEFTSVDLTITNEGPLPLRDVQVAANHDWGWGKISYLPEATSKTISFSMETPDTPGKFSLQIEWTGLTLDGQHIQGKREIAFDLIETESSGDTDSVDLGDSPYFVSEPVGPNRDDVFFGRDELLAEMKQQIKSGNVILLEGNRRAGKSSILKHLEGLNTVQGWLGVYCSFQGAEGSKQAVGMPTAEVWREIALSIAEGLLSLGGEIPLPDGTILPAGVDLGIAAACRRGIGDDAPWSDFREYLKGALKMLSQKGVGLLLMLDEFDKLQQGIDNGVTSPQIPENIRYLVQNIPQLSAVLTGSRRLKRLREEYWSALYGLGNRFGVTSLYEEAAQRLVVEPVQGRLTYSREAIERAIYLTSRQPYLLQCLCNRIFRMAGKIRSRSVGLDLVNQAGEALVEENEHFASLWDYAWSDLRRFLLALCQRESGGPDILRLPVIQEHLLNYGIEISDDRLIADLEFLRELELIEFVGDSGGGHYELAIPMMGIWIEKEKDFTAVLAKARFETEDQHE